MESQKDVSYGVLPIRKGKAGWEILLIHQYSKIGKNSYWVFPKGHPEGVETAQETAVRELKEETGLEVETLLAEPTFLMSYTFMFDGTKIEKTVEFFIGVIEETDLTLDKEEVKEADWFNLEEVVDRLDYQNTRDMFKKAKQFISTL